MLTRETNQRVLFAIFSAASSAVAAAAAVAFWSQNLAAQTPSDTGKCPAPWQCSQTTHEVQSQGVIVRNPIALSPSIRSGYVPENPNVPFRGNVIYYQGLGDSMLNHLPLFSLIADAGLRVIAFDYMGQGGSSGEMNDTRIFEIVKLGRKIWQQHAREIRRFPQKRIIGWSTGGLAAYVEAIVFPRETHAVVLIAPGIFPNKIVGEQDLLHGVVNRITLETLTTARYSARPAAPTGAEDGIDHQANGGAVNPHVDPISPDSPLKVWRFAYDLLRTARKVRKFPVDRSVRGLVLLSGPEDTYVNSAKTRAVIRERATHFELSEHSSALHEIDNEAEPVGSYARREILNFILRN